MFCAGFVIKINNEFVLISTNSECVHNSLSQYGTMKKRYPVPLLFSPTLLKVHPYKTLLAENHV